MCLDLNKTDDFFLEKNTALLQNATFTSQTSKGEINANSQCNLEPCSLYVKNIQSESEADRLEEDVAGRIIQSV